MKDVVEIFSDLESFSASKIPSHGIIVFVDDEGSVFVDGDDEGYVAPGTIQALGDGSHGWGSIDPDPGFLGGNVPLSGIPEMQPFPRI